MIGKIRVQILTAIVLLGAITGYAIFADMVEVATSTIAGMTALGMKVLDND
jgi:H+/gluconate symporter-like permease